MAFACIFDSDVLLSEMNFARYVCTSAAPVVNKILFKGLTSM